MGTKANDICAAMFQHAAYKPQHRNIAVMHALGFDLGWRFRCLDCGLEWHIRHMELQDDPITAKLIRDGHGPAKLLAAMLSLPMATTKPNAWDRVTDGFLDDDT